MTGGDWNGVSLQEAKACHRGEKIALDLAEPCLAPAGEVHFIHRQHNARHTHQLQNRCVPPCLLLKPMPCIDQHHGGIGVTRAARHISCVLIVPGAVDKNEPALAGIQIAPGDIDGNSLFALGREAVEKQAVVEFFRRARGASGTAHPFPLVAGQFRGLPQQAANQR